MHFGIFLSLSQKVFAEITVRNNLDFGYTAGAVNSADAYEKNAFQQKCIVRMRMRKMRFNRNAMSIFYGYLVFCFFPSTMPVRGSKPGKLSDNDSCPTFCGCVYDIKSTNRNL